MTETFIDIGIRILEPVTAITDLMLGLFCIWFYRRLALPVKSHPLLRFWRLFFLSIGISTLLGTVAHGLRFYMNEPTFKAVWMLMNLTSIVSSYFLLLATIEIQFRNPEMIRRMQHISLLITLLLVSVTMYFNDFNLIKIYAGLIILIALITHFSTYKKGIKGSGYITFGFTFSLSSIWVHTQQLSIDDYFNFKDISHVIMLISLYFIFMGAMLKTRLSRDTEAPAVAA